jgi:DNA polymerase-3 subunit gamma/tau
MAYTVLARRYRSQTFDDVIGQDAVAQTLKNAIKTGHVAHAYLFTGTRGVGKTTMARILAKALNCLKVKEPTPDPCCKCDSCTSINIGEDIDVIEIDGASNTGVDNIRQLRQNAIYRPARARHKIYIIDEVHMLSTGAFNALLKTLEEPPDHVKFIFATTEPNKVLPTIQSRCQRFDFGMISPALIADQLKTILKSEKIKFADDLILRLSRLANGSMRDALSLLDQLISTGAQPLTIELIEQCLGIPSQQKVCQLLTEIGDKDPAVVLATVDQLLRTGQTPTQILDALIDCIRDLMVILSTDSQNDLLILTTDERKALSAAQDKFDIPSLIYNITALEKLRWTIKNSDNPRALLEACMLRLTLSEHFMSTAHLLTQIDSAQTSPKTPVKKKSVENGEPVKPTARAGLFNSQDNTPAPDASVPQPVLTDTPTLESVKQNWQGIIDTVKTQTPTVAGFLTSANPADLSNNILTISFPASARFAQDMCQKKCDQLTSSFSLALGTDIRLKFETDSRNSKKTPTRIPGARMPQKEKNKVLTDPAVRTLLKGLDATPVEIERIDKD